MNSTDAPAPLVLLCAPRSFSSVAAAMLGQHPSLYATPELNLFAADRVDQLFALEEAYSTPGLMLGGVIRTWAQLELGSQSEYACERAKRWLLARLHWPTAEVLKVLCALAAPRRLVDKSPRTTLCWESCQRAASVMPGTRFLHLTRHPAGAIRSLVSTLPVPGPGAVQAMARLWLFAQEHAIRLTALQPKASCLRVHGEDFVESTESALARILEWLGLSSSDQALREMTHPERSPYAYALAFTSVNDNDTGFLSSPALRRGQPVEEQGTLRELGLDPAIQRELGAMALQLEYGSANCA